jgi:hypothetical protein
VGGARLEKILTRTTRTKSCAIFSCPCAYGTVQRGSLIPVPDVLQYKDQLDG